MISTHGHGRTAAASPLAFCLLFLGAWGPSPVAINNSCTPPPSPWALPAAPVGFDRTVERWRPRVVSHADVGDLPVDFVLAWLQLESDGILEAYVPSTGEAGLFQISPMEARLLRIDLARVLVDRDYAMTTGLRYVQRQRVRAVRLLAAVGVSWQGVDLWTMTKMQHNAPGLAEAGLQLFAVEFGRGPADWVEFATWMRGATRRLGCSPKFAAWVLANAEAVGERT